MLEYKCNPKEMQFCPSLKMAMEHQFIGIRHFDKLYVCCDVVSMNRNDSIVLDLKDEPVIGNDGKVVPEAVQEQQAIVLKGGRLTMLNLFYYCNFCGVKLDIPNPPKKEKQEGGDEKK